MQKLDFLEGINYKIVRSSRRSVGMQFKNGALIIRAPFRLSDRDVANCLLKNLGWINKHAAISARREEQKRQTPKLTPEEIKSLKLRAAEILPERVRHYARLAGVDYGKITIRAQKTRWGSCSAKGDLSFNCLLMLTPPNVMDGVVAHEICHRKRMDHSPLFYNELAKIFPGYAECRRWLKEKGDGLFARL